MNYKKITEEIVKQKLSNILREENFEYQKIQVDKIAENFNIHIWKKDDQGELKFAIPIEYFEDEDRKTELKKRLGKIIRNR